MKRFQLYLDDDIYERLLTESKIKKTRISALIRDALREKYLEQEKTSLVIRSLSGIWKDREGNTSRIFREIRYEKK
jgi:hypothetical protein